MRALFSSPSFSNPEMTQRAGDLFKLAWVVLIGFGLSVELRVINQPELALMANLYLAVVAVPSVVALFLNYRGWTRLASWLLIVGYITIVSFAALTSGGIRAPAFSMVYIYAMTASLLLGLRAGLITAIVCSLIGLGLTAAEYWGVLPPQRYQYSAFNLWIMNSFYLGMTIFLVRLMSQSMRRAFAREEAELAQRQKAEDKLSIALDAGEIGVWEWTPATGEVVWDDRMHDMYGIPRGTKIDYKIWASHVLPDELSQQETALYDSLAQGRGKREFPIRGTDGGIRHVSAAWRIFAECDGTPRKVIGINVDVTKQREAEEAISDMKQRLETLIREARVGILVHSNFKPLTANQELVRMLGYGDEADVLAIADLRELLCPQSRHLKTEANRRRREGDDHRDVLQLRCRRKDDRWIDVESRSFPIQWGDELCICAMWTDVTQQRALEAQLRRSQRLEAIGQMTGGIAHDFNNLLTVILGNADVLERKLAKDKQLHEFAEMTLLAAERGAELTSRLLAFSRRQSLDIRPTDIVPLLDGFEALLQRAVGRHIQIKVLLSPSLRPALVDGPQLESALLNLVVNARDAMADGGMVVIEARNVTLDANANDSGRGLTMGEPVSGDFVGITVTDTGSGMDGETLVHAFDPFFTTKTVGKGSGLGLSMVHGFITHIRGRIRIASKCGQGTAITLYLPAAPDVAPLMAAKTAPHLQKGDEKILVVEDDELVRRQVCAQLESLGYRVVSARNGAEALAYLGKTTDFDLLFTDVMMPGGIGGPELARLARQRYGDLPVLLTSGYADDALLQTYVLEEGAHLLAKPYKLEQLSQKLREMLKSRRTSEPALSETL